MSDAQSTQDCCRRFADLCKQRGVEVCGPIGIGERLELHYSTGEDTDQRIEHTAMVLPMGMRLVSRLMPTAHRPLAVALLNELNNAAFDGSFCLDPDDWITFRLSVLMPAEQLSEECLELMMQTQNIVLRFTVDWLRQWEQDPDSDPVLTVLNWPLLRRGLQEQQASTEANHEPA